MKNGVARGVLFSTQWGLEHYGVDDGRNIEFLPVSNGIIEQRDVRLYGRNETD